MMEKHYLVYLYFDQFAGLVDAGENSIIVDDAATYSKARQAIEILKAGDEFGPLTVIVRSHQYFAGFRDMTHLGTLVKISRIAPRNDITNKLHIQIPAELTDRDLLALGIKGVEDLQIIIGDREIASIDDLDDILLSKAFGSQAFCISPEITFQNWFTNLIDYLYTKQTQLQIGWKIGYTRQLVQERISVCLEQYEKNALIPFLSDVILKTQEGKAQIYLNQFAVRYWIKSYPKLARKTVIANMINSVGQWQEIKDESTVLNSLTPWCEFVYDQIENSLVEQLESVLTLLFEDEFVDSEDVNKLLELLSGRFEAEFTVAQARLAILFLDSKSENITELNSKFSKYLELLNCRFERLFEKTGLSVERVNWLNDLFKFNDIVLSLGKMAPSCWIDWLATYELLIIAKRLKKRILDATPDTFLDPIDNVNANFSILNEKFNAAYSDWLLKVYPGLINAKGDQPLLVMNAARLALEFVDNGNKVILLVFDALDWELWQNLRHIITQHDLNIQSSEAGLAMLPTITEFSRRAIFGGLTPRNLANFIDDIYGVDISPQEESKIFARALGYLGRISQIKAYSSNKRIQMLSNEFVYVNGNAADFRQALQIDARYYALVYTEIDAHIHVSKLEEQALKDTVTQWLSALVDDVVMGINQNPSLRSEANLKIIITSDHGFLDISESVKAEIDSSLNILVDLERHGRLAIVHGKDDEDITKAAKIVNEFWDKHSTVWHLIERKQSEQFGLAESSSSEGEVVAWLMPRLFQYVKKGRGNYAHGGLSMYETIVPLVVLGREVTEFAMPVITITGELFSEEPGVLSIAILNKNIQPFRELVLMIQDYNIRDSTIDYVSPGEVKKLSVTVVPPISGEISIQIVIEGEIGGIKKRFEETHNLTIKPGRKERMRLSTRRSLDDDQGM